MNAPVLQFSWPEDLPNPFASLPEGVKDHMLYLWLRAPYLTGNDAKVAAATAALQGAEMGECLPMEHIRRPAVCALLGWPGDDAHENMVSHGWAAMEKHGLTIGQLEPHSGNPDHRGYDPELPEDAYWRDKFIGWTGRHPMQHPAPDIDDVDTVASSWCPVCKKAHPMTKIRGAKLKDGRVLAPGEYELAPYYQCPQTGAILPEKDVHIVRVIDESKTPVYYESGKRRHLPPTAPNTDTVELAAPVGATLADSSPQVVTPGRPCEVATCPEVVPSLPSLLTREHSERATSTPEGATVPYQPVSMPQYRMYQCNRPEGHLWLIPVNTPGVEWCDWCGSNRPGERGPAP